MGLINNLDSYLFVIISYNLTFIDTKVNLHTNYIFCRVIFYLNVNICYNYVVFRPIVQHF